MKTVRVLAAALTTVVVASAGCTSDPPSNRFHFTGAQQPGRTIALADRKPAGDFSGALLAGGTYRLTQDAGKVVVINFWGTWCGPCKVETPQFDQVFRANKAKGVDFVGIDVKEASRDQPKAFVKDYIISYPIVYDETSETAIRLGDIPTTATPFTVVLDRQHRVAGVYIIRLAPTDLQPVLDSLLAEK